MNCSITFIGDQHTWLDQTTKKISEGGPAVCLLTNVSGKKYAGFYALSNIGVVDNFGGIQHARFFDTFCLNILYFIL